MSTFTGLFIWVALVVPERDNRDAEVSELWWVMLIAGAALGVVFAYDERAPAIGFGLVTLPLLLAPFTAPRGDNDGLWILIFPYLVVFGCVLMLVAMLSGWLWRLTKMLVERPNHRRP